MKEAEWRCRNCGKLIGVVRDDRLHLRFSRGHEYLVGFPVTSACRACRTLNEASSSTDAVVTSQALIPQR